MAAQARACRAAIVSDSDPSHGQRHGQSESPTMAAQARALEQPSSATRIRAMVSDSDPSHGQRHGQSPAVEHDVRGTLEAEEICLQSLPSDSRRARAPRLGVDGLRPSRVVVTAHARTPRTERAHSAYRVRAL
jgi:hypothetical protein